MTNYAENQQFAWVMEDCINSGTIDTYVNDLETAHYASLLVGNEVWDGNTTVKVEVTSDGKDRDDYLYSTIKIGNLARTMRIDGRA